MSRILMPKQHVLNHLCAVMHSHVRLPKTIENLDFGEFVKTTAYADAKMNTLIDFYSKDGSGGVKLSCTHQEWKNWVINIRNLHSNWQKGVNKNDFKKAARWANRVDEQIIDTFIPWFPQSLQDELAAMGPDFNESGKTDP